MIGALIAGLVPTALGALAGAAPQLFTKSRTEDRVNNIYSSSGNPALAGSMSGASASIKQDRYKETIEEPTTFAKIAPWLGLAGGAAGALAPDIKNLLKDDKPEAKKGITEGKKGRKIVSIEPIEGKQHEEGGEDVEVGGEQVEAEGGEFKVIFDDGTEAVLTAEQMERLKQGEDIESIVQELPTVEEAKKDVQTNDLMQGGSQVPEKGESALGRPVMARTGVIDPINRSQIMQQKKEGRWSVPKQSQSAPGFYGGVTPEMVANNWNPEMLAAVGLDRTMSASWGQAEADKLTGLVNTRYGNQLAGKKDNLFGQDYYSVGLENNTHKLQLEDIKVPDLTDKEIFKSTTVLTPDDFFYKSSDRHLKSVYPIEESLKDLNRASLASNALISAGTIASNIGNNVPDFTLSPLQAYDPVNIERVNPNAVIANINKQANTAMRATTEMGKDPTKALGAIFDASNQATGQVNQANLQAGQSEASINQQGANQVKGMNAEINRFNKSGKYQNELDKITQKTQRRQAMIDSIGKVLQSYVGGKSMLTQDMINRIAGDYGDDYGQMLVPDKQAVRKERKQINGEKKTKIDNTPTVMEEDFNKKKDLRALNKFTRQNDKLIKREDKYVHELIVNRDYERLKSLFNNNPMIAKRYSYLIKENSF